MSSGEVFLAAAVLRRASQKHSLFCHRFGSKKKNNSLWAFCVIVKTGAVCVWPWVSALWRECKRCTVGSLLRRGDSRLKRQTTARLHFQKSFNSSLISTSMLWKCTQPLLKYRGGHKRWEKKKSTQRRCAYDRKQTSTNRLVLQPGFATKVLQPNPLMDLKMQPEWENAWMGLAIFWGIKMQREIRDLALGEQGLSFSEFLSSGLRIKSGACAVSLTGA